MTSQKAVQRYGEAMVPLSEPLQEANTHWTNAGLKGIRDLPSLDFERALREMRQAESLYTRINTSLHAIQPGDELLESHRFMLLAGDRYLDASSMAVQFLEKCNEASTNGRDAVVALDGGILSRASEIYDLASTNAINSAHGVFAATAAIDRP